jgi:hypothetical protein
MSEQSTPTPEVPSDLLAVNDLDHFIVLLTGWHNRQVATVEHLRDAPTGITVIVGEGEEAKEQKLEGEFLAGFQLGIGLALNYLGKMPFMAEYADVPPAVH